MKQTIRLRGWFMAPDKVWEIERPDHYQGWPVHSQAFVCPQCLWVWGTLGEAPFEVKTAPCAMHQHSSHPILYPVAGSILDNGTFLGPDLDLLEALPLELKQREFDLHIRQMEIDSHDQSSATNTTSRGFALSGSECPA